MKIWGCSIILPQKVYFTNLDDPGFSKLTVPLKAIHIFLVSAENKIDLLFDNSSYVTEA